MKVNLHQERTVFSRRSTSFSLPLVLRLLRCRVGVGAVAVNLTALLLLSGLTAGAQTTITSNPLDGATNVSTTASVVFTFSSPMNTSAGSTSAFFTPTPPTGIYQVTSAWSAGNTVLTCTPVSPFPNNTTVTWNVVGMDANSGFVSATGTFTTGTGGGGGGGGSGTNAFTTFSAGKVYYNEQLTAGAATPVADFAYAFFASASLASNRTATSVTVTVPGASTPDSMTQNPSRHENYEYFAWTNNQTTFETLYPEGSYAFNVTGTPNNLSGTVTLPTTMLQPNAPHISNFAAAQVIDATLAFTLKWDPFTNGTASDFISVAIHNDSGTVFQTPAPGTNGALTGLATSVTIPAGKLSATASNTTDVIFFKWLGITNASYASVAFRATETQLSLVSAGSVVATTPVVSNPSWGASGFGFDVATSLNQSLVILYSTDLVQWQTLYTTNSPGSSVHINVSTQLGASAFFRIKNGP